MARLYQKQAAGTKTVTTASEPEAVKGIGVRPASSSFVPCHTTLVVLLEKPGHIVQANLFPLMLSLSFHVSAEMV